MPARMSRIVSDKYMKLLQGALQTRNQTSALKQRASCQKSRDVEQIIF